MRIRDTLTLGTIMVSEPMLEEVDAHPSLEALGEPEPFAFTPDGRLEPIRARDEPRGGLTHLRAGLAARVRSAIPLNERRLPRGAAVSHCLLRPGG